MARFPLRFPERRDFFLEGSGVFSFAQRSYWPAPICAEARLCWLRDQNLLKEAHRALAISDWVTYRLCGEFVAEPSHSSQTLLLDLEAEDWSRSRMDELGLERSLLPPIRPSGTRVGALSADAAETLGLAPGTAVALGGADTQCGLLGAGAVDDGDLAAIAGTTAPVQLVLSKPTLEAEGRLWTARHVVPGRWVLESNAGPVGEVLDWLGEVLYAGAAHPLTQLCAEAAEARLGAGGILSSLGGEVMNGRSLAMPMGHLSLSHLASPYDPPKRAHLVRAVLEGMAYAVRANIEQVVEAAGIELPPLRLSGGMSRSSVWAQILCDVLGKPVSVTASPEASALGAALCAGVGAGVFE